MSYWHEGNVSRNVSPELFTEYTIVQLSIPVPLFCVYKDGWVAQLKEYFLRLTLSIVSVIFLYKGDFFPSLIYIVDSDEKIFRETRRYLQYQGRRHYGHSWLSR